MPDQDLDITNCDVHCAFLMVLCKKSHNYSKTSTPFTPSARPWLSKEIFYPRMPGVTKNNYYLSVMNPNRKV